MLVSTSDQVRVLVKEDRKDECSSEREEYHEEAQGADKDWLLRTTRTFSSLSQAFAIGFESCNRSRPLCSHHARGAVGGG